MNRYATAITQAGKFGLSSFAILAAAALRPIFGKPGASNPMSIEMIPVNIPVVSSSAITAQKSNGKTELFINGQPKQLKDGGELPEFVYDLLNDEDGKVGQVLLVAERTSVQSKEVSYALVFELHDPKFGTQDAPAVALTEQEYMLMATQCRKGDSVTMKGVQLQISAHLNGETAEVPVTAFFLKLTDVRGEEGEAGYLPLFYAQHPMTAAQLEQSEVLQAIAPKLAEATGLKPENLILAGDKRYVAPELVARYGLGWIYSLVQDGKLETPRELQLA
ncbi:hypothetical protein JNK13_00240 [bacterium]|nr:hypothetical protein [bacterium]